MTINSEVCITTFALVLDTQHVDLRSGPRNNETFNPSCSQLFDIPKQLLRAAHEKKFSYYLG